MTDPRIGRIAAARFPTANMGYGTTQTHALLNAVRTALEAGLPVNALLAAKNLPDVSYGYDKAQVDAFLADMADPSDPLPTMEFTNPAEPAPSQPTAADGRSETDRAELLESIRRIRFRMARRGSHGYDVMDVDSFLDQVEKALNADEPLDFVATAQFRMASRGSTGYDVGDVDEFVDTLTSPDARPGAAPASSEDSFWHKFAAFLGLTARR